VYRAQTQKKCNKKQKKRTKPAETTRAKKRSTRATKMQRCKFRSKRVKRTETAQNKSKTSRHYILNAQIIRIVGRNALEKSQHRPEQQNKQAAKKEHAKSTCKMQSYKQKKKAERRKKTQHNCIVLYNAFPIVQTNVCARNMAQQAF